MTVTFSGGLGAQILSLAIVLDFHRRNIPVGINLDYFSQQPRIAGPGEGISVWPWGLDLFGFSYQQVLDLSNFGRETRAPILEDSPQKFALGVEALLRPEIRNQFPSIPVPHNFDALGLEIHDSRNRYVAFHLRRGDYLNVASYLVPDFAYTELASKVSKAFDCAIVVSDSYLNSQTRNFFTQEFNRVEILEGPEHDSGQIHHLLRNSAMHFGSNGQFSLTAGVLGDGLFFRPKPWFGQDSPYDALLENFAATSMQIFLGSTPQLDAD